VTFGCSAGKGGVQDRRGPPMGGREWLFFGEWAPEEVNHLRKRTHKSGYPPWGKKEISPSSKTHAPSDYPGSSPRTPTLGSTKKKEANTLFPKTKSLRMMGTSAPRNFCHERKEKGEGRKVGEHSSRRGGGGVSTLWPQEENYGREKRGIRKGAKVGTQYRPGGVEG